MSQASLLTAGAVSASRLESLLSGLAAFGARTDGGVDRLALSAEELAARRWLVMPFLQKNGYEIVMDAAANLFIRRNGLQPQAPCVLAGSHIDTQPAGGRYDGAFGVCAGLEILAALDEGNITTRRPIEIVIWNNEEGVRFSPGLTGSSLFAHPERFSELAELKDDHGITMQAACQSAQDDMASFIAAHGKTLVIRPSNQSVSAYLEAHIEQGPILEQKGISVGCVTGIQAVRWLQITVSGRSAHAGTTPLSDRDDAMVKAVRLADRILALADGDENDLRLTLGRWCVSPDAINTIACSVTFTLDLRHPDAARLDALEQAIRAQLPAASAVVSTLFEKPAVQFDSNIMQAIEQHGAELGIASQRLISGAFHDALNLADICPTAMIFSPSCGGISHHPDEFTPAEDLWQCTRVLAKSVCVLAEGGEG